MKRYIKPISNKIKQNKSIVVIIAILLILFFFIPDIFKSEKEKRDEEILGTDNDAVAEAWNDENFWSDTFSNENVVGDYISSDQMRITEPQYKTLMEAEPYFIIFGFGVGYDGIKIRSVADSIANGSYPEMELKLLIEYFNRKNNLTIKQWFYKYTEEIDFKYFYHVISKAINESIDGTNDRVIPQRSIVS